MRDMLGREELITVEKAIELLFRYAPFRRPAETHLPIEKSCGIIISRDIISPEDLPSFHRLTQTDLR